MRVAISKIICLLIFVTTSYAFADTKLPKCLIFTFGNCLGKLTYPNGDTFTGEFNYGQPNGSGKMIYVNGDHYVGNFYEGQKHGIGEYTWADGNRYIGQFIDGSLEGRGAYYFLGKNKISPDKYIGDFKKNVFSGDGVYTYGNGGVVSGKFKDGKKIEEPAAVASQAQKKPAEDRLSIESNKVEENFFINLARTIKKSSTSKVKEFSAPVDVEGLKVENSSLLAKIENQARADNGLRVKPEKEAFASLVAQEKALFINEENIKLKIQIESQKEVDRILRVKLEQEAASALVAQEKVKFISDENAKLKSQIEVQAELNSIPKVKDFLALVDVERLKAENSILLAKIERQTRADRGLRVRLEKEAAAALIAQKKVQSISEENTRLRSQIEGQIDVDRILLMKIEDVQANAKNNNSTDVVGTN